MARVFITNRKLHLSAYSGHHILYVQYMSNIIYNSYSKKVVKT